MKNLLDQADYETFLSTLRLQATTLALSLSSAGKTVPESPALATIMSPIKMSDDGTEAQCVEHVDLIHSCELMEAHIAQLKALSSFAPKICELAGAGGKSGVAVAPLFNQPARLQSPSKPMTATEKLLAARGVSSVDQLRNTPKP